MPNQLELPTEVQTPAVAPLAVALGVALAVAVAVTLAAEAARACTARRSSDAISTVQRIRSSSSSSGKSDNYESVAEVR